MFEKPAYRSTDVLLSGLALILLFFIYPVETWGDPQAGTPQTAVVTGRIVDGETSEPLPMANVYLANTMMGTSTNEDGYFAIVNVPPGRYAFVASFIGYEPYKRNIRLREGEEEQIVIRLMPSALTMDEVVVSAVEPKEWRRNLDVFRNTFFGWSANASECAIRNAELMHFDHDRSAGIFSARADNMLRLENRALGYGVDLLLEKFTVSGRTINFRGEPRFTELAPSGPGDAMTWRRNRLKAYRGSRRHFLACMFNGTVEENGYKIHLLPTIEESARGLFYEEILPDSIMEESGLPSTKFLSFTGYLKVTYYDEKEPMAYVNFKNSSETRITRLTLEQLRGFGEGGYQESWLKLEYPRVAFNSRGIVLDQLAMTSHGYWAWERFADTLPLDYEPPEEAVRTAPALTASVRPETAPVTFDSLLFIDRKERRSMLSVDPEYTRLVSRSSADPGDVEALNSLGYLLIRYGRHDSARVVFERSIEIDDSSADAHTGLGRAWFETGLEKPFVPSINEKELVVPEFRKAADEFSRALDIDPGFNKSKSYLADVYIAQGGTAHRRTARDILTGLIGENPSYPDAQYRLGLVCYNLDEMEDAEAAFTRQLEIDAGHAPAQLYLGMVCFRLGDNENAARNYLSGLENLRDPGIIEDAAAYMFPLFTDDEKRTFAAIPAHLRGAFLAAYWKRRDPNIMTAENERLTEHLSRVHYVKDNYSRHGARRFDDRGMIYLKYGKPDDVYRDPTPRFVRENESWIYSSIDNNLAFDFVLTGASFTLVPDLTWAKKPGTTFTNMEGIYRQVYLDRSLLGGIYAELAGKIQAAGGSQVTRVIDEFGYMSSQAQVNAPAEHFAYAGRAGRFAFPLSLAQFRGSGGKTAIELYFGVPYNELHFGERDNRTAAGIMQQLAVRDSLGNDAGGAARRTYFLHSGGGDEAGRFVVGNDIAEVSPGLHTVGFRVSPDSSARTGTYQLSVPVRNFSGKSLMVSDIMICGNDGILVVEQGKGRHELGIVPYPFVTIEKSRPLVLYYEIYNLTAGPGGTAAYTVTWSVRHADTGQESGASGILRKLGRLFTGGGASEISMTQERSGSAPDARESISLDIDKLPEGKAVISVRITDRQTGRSSEITRSVVITK